jgi:creatinine amidohydrolase
MTPARLWAELTAPEIQRLREDAAVVLLPVGSIEQHGPHLPVDTDISGAYETAKEISRRRRYAVVAPPVWWGLSGQHRKFPGFLTLRPETFYGLLQDLCDSILDQGFTNLVVVVGHASNKPVVTMLVGQMAERRNARILQLNYLELARDVFMKIRRSGIGGDAHAGELETAVQMHLRPGWVRLDDVPVHPVDPARDFGHSAAMKDIFAPGQIVVGWDLATSFPEGVMGDPSVATPDTGKAVWNAIISRACEIVDEYRASAIEKRKSSE